MAAEIKQYKLEPDGTGVPVDLVGDGLGAMDPAAPGFYWVHVRMPEEEEEPAWMTRLGLDELVRRALFEVDTRPRCTVHGEGVLMNLRGVNVSPGAEPEDMVSMRMWITGKLVVTTQRRPLMAATDVIQAIERGQGPDGPAELVARLALRLADRAEPVIAGLNERIDDLEEQVLEESASVKRGDLADIRRMAIVLRRYLAPQRDALSTFEIEDMPFVRPRDRSRLREATERMTRLAEELDAIRDRSQVVFDQIMDTRAELMNRQMLVLAVVSAVFLPLGLVTGLLGINVGGIPGAGSPYAFWVVLAALVATGVILVLVFRRRGWLR